MEHEATNRTNHDTSGYAVFAAGDIGAMHVMAHEMLDTGLFEQGHARLGAWLEGRIGQGSEWIHLQWHMAVFELALGYWDDAHARFLTHILPAATTEDALTDAPAMLWRLHLAAPKPVELPWEAVRATAASSLKQSDRYIELHGLLALAGARDVEGLDRWLASRSDDEARIDSLVTQMAEGLRDYVYGDYEQAAETLSTVVSSVSEIGGSRAQNELFVDIATMCRRLAGASLWRAA